MILGGELLGTWACPAYLGMDRWGMGSGSQSSPGSGAFTHSQAGVKEWKDLTTASGQSLACYEKTDSDQMLGGIQRLCPTCACSCEPSVMVHQGEIS